MAGSDDDSQRTNKRQRISQACNACRRKKSRCNGVRPACSSCTELGLYCEYLSDVEQANALASQQVATLVQRIAELENRVADTEAMQSHDRQSLQRVFQTNPSLPSTAPSGTHGESPMVAASPQNTSTDGLAHFVHAGAGDHAYYGPSSNIALMRDIADATARILEPLRQQTLSNDNQQSIQDQLGASRDQIFAISRPASPRGNRVNPVVPFSHTDAYALPSESRTKLLLDHYFRETGALFPYVFRDEFLDTYTAWRHRKRVVQPEWVALLNIMLALAVHSIWTMDTHDSTGWEARHQESALFYQRATQLCSPDVLDHATVEAVQCLTLTAQYLQGTSTSIKTWAVHGLAVKVALQLGLHSRSAAAALDARERERRKRTWYGCIILDRTLSMTFGRPPIIPNHHVQLSLPQILDSTPAETDAFESLCTDFFSSTIALYKINGRVVTDMFNDNLDVDLKVETTKIFCQSIQLEDELLQWSTSLPLGLIEPGESLPPVHDNRSRLMAKFRVVLTMRYHNLRILIQRPILTAALAATKLPDVSNGLPKCPIASSVLLAALNSGLTSAAHVIDLVHSIIHGPAEQRQLLGAWWFTLYYTFNAALIIFASVLLPRQVCESLETMSSPIRSLQDKQTCVGRAAGAIEQLYESNRRGLKVAVLLRRLEKLVKHMTPSTYAPLEPGGVELGQQPTPFNDSWLSAEQSLDHLWALHSADTTNTSQVPIIDDWDSLNFNALLGIDPVFDNITMPGFS